jgi:hypothetical protein
MIDTDNLKGRVKKYTHINDGIVQEKKVFDEQGRETACLNYSEGKLSWSVANHYTAHGFISIHEHYGESGAFEGKRIDFHDVDGDVILSESYNNRNELVKSRETGIKQPVTNALRQLTEIALVRRDKAYTTERFEYDAEGRLAKAQRFNEEGALLLSMTNEYDGNAVTRKIYNYEGILFEINRVGFANGRLVEGIQVSRYPEPPYFIENLFDDWKGLKPKDYKLDGYKKDWMGSALTDEQRQTFPEICSLLDMLQFDIDGKRIDFEPSLHNFSCQMESAYDATGRQVSQTKDLYWPEFSTEHLTNESYWKKVYNPEGLLIEEENGLTESEWDSWNHYFYEYTFDGQGRVAQKRWKNLHYDKHGVVNYSYNANSSCVMERMDSEGKVDEITVTDRYGNCVYEKAVYSDGSGSHLEELDIEYYE